MKIVKDWIMKDPEGALKAFGMGHLLKKRRVERRNHEQVDFLPFSSIRVKKGKGNKGKSAQRTKNGQKFTLFTPLLFHPFPIRNGLRTLFVLFS
jgi:hypothetical protein